jgi:hypothetical protein
MLEDFKTDAEIAAEKERLRLLAFLPSRKFDVLNPPPKLEPTFTINGVAVATAGNISAIQSKAKVGKSAFCGALVASLFGTPDADTFGIEGSNPHGWALVHFDTEQSPQDHHAVVQTALTRAKARECPEWLRSYWLVDVPMLDRFKVLEAELAAAFADHGGIRAVILDGIGDFLADPNDPGEAFGLIEKLHALAVKYRCVIWLVLHENPGSESGKTRGHLGSQLERKAESNVRLEKDADGVTVAFFDKARHGFLPREDGPRFKWSDELGMHSTIRESKREADQNRKDRDNREMAFGVIQAIFSDDPNKVCSYAELLTQVVEIECVSKETAKRRIRVIRDLTLLRKSPVENGWILTEWGKNAVTQKEAHE